MLLGRTEGLGRAVLQPRLSPPCPLAPIHLPTSGPLGLVAGRRLPSHHCGFPGPGLEPPCQQVGGTGGHQQGSWPGVRAGPAVLCPPPGHQGPCGSSWDSAQEQTRRETREGRAEAGRTGWAEPPPQRVHGPRATA